MFHLRKVLKFDGNSCQCFPSQIRHRYRSPSQCHKYRSVFSLFWTSCCRHRSRRPPQFQAASWSLPPQPSVRWFMKFPNGGMLHTVLPARSWQTALLTTKFDFELGEALRNVLLEQAAKESPPLALLLLWSLQVCNTVMFWWHINDIISVIR